MLELSGGKLPVAQAYKEYSLAWKDFLKSNSLTSLEKLVKPTTLSWKVADKNELFANLKAVADNTEQVHVGTVNNRFIASIVLKTPIQDQFYLLKILERRPVSSDPLGLDSIDFLCLKDTSRVKKMLIAVGANVVTEKNDMHDWISLRFGPDNQYEAKFTDHLVLSVAIKELRISEDKLIQNLT